MRRRTPGVVGADDLIAPRIRAAEARDPARVVRLLEPLVMAARRERLNAVLDARLSSVTVVFDAPHDPHNGAAVVRSCEAFGVQRIHVVERRERFLAAPSVARGAGKWVDLVVHRDPREAVRALRDEGFELVAAHHAGELAPHDLAAIPKLALFLGNERDGIGADLEAACTRRVHVPMRGFVESLNVSVTAAILLSAATEGRAGDLSEQDRLRLYARGLYFSVQRAEDVLTLAADSD